MELDSGSLILSIIFSGFGMFLFMFGKKSGRMPHLIAMTLVCLVLAVAPFFIQES